MPSCAGDEILAYELQPKSFSSDLVILKQSLREIMSEKLAFLVTVMALIFFMGYSAYASDVGTRENPVPMGSSVDLGDGWQITVLDVIPDATDIVLKENMFNKQPKAGDQFFLTMVAIKYTGSGSSTFNGGYRLRAVGPSSVGYSTFENNPGVIPDPLPSSDVFSGGVIKGYIGWEIKSSDASALEMYDKPLSFGNQANPIFMALYR
jgi:hypothetical protein